MATIKYCQITAAQASTIVQALNTNGYPTTPAQATTNFGALAIESSGELTTLEHIQSNMVSDDATHFMYIKDGTLSATTLSSVNALFEAFATQWDKPLDLHVVSL